MTTDSSSLSQPNYVRLHESGELEKRVRKALDGLKRCQVCPWSCEVDRLSDERKICETGRYALVSSCFPHYGEEDCLRGWRGSGTIFFASCNLRCIFCQNYDISHARAGIEVLPEQLAGMMLELQQRGCHNINFVTPTHVVPQILEALPTAIEAGLRLPIVYNTGGFDAIHSLRLMDGIVDIYMPDFKYWYAGKAKRYLNTDRYPEVARQAFQEMHRQVGALEIDDQGIAQRGVLVRHLVMPGGLDDTREIMRFLANELSPDTFVNIMAQYHPEGKVRRGAYGEINRCVSADEMREAYRLAREAGLHRFDVRQAI